MLEPWLLSQGGVHSWMKSLFFVVAQRTHPSGPVLDRSGFHGENIFVFFIKKEKIQIQGRTRFEEKTATVP